MSVDQAREQGPGQHLVPKKKKDYQPPQLVCYGSVSAMTRSGVTGPSESSAMEVAFMFMSDIRSKHNMARIGTHPLGFGLYLFDYRPEFGTTEARQFGVLAQEVEAVMPAAVVTSGDGYKQVNYAMLGIARPGRLS